MSAILKFFADPDSTEISSFRIYRSILGAASATEPFDVQNKSFVYRYRDADKFVKFSFKSNDPQEIVDQINEHPGIQASVAGTSPNRTIILRGSTDILELIKTAGLEALGITSGVYREKQNFTLVGSEAFVSGTAEYSFEDPDGSPRDYYRVSEVDGSSNENPPGPPQRAYESLEPVCYVEGRIVASEGAEALEGAEVRAQPYIEDSISDWKPSKEWVSTFTDENGKWRLVLPRGVRYYLEIPRVEYSNAVVIPDQNTLFLGDILVDRTWRAEDTLLPPDSGLLGE